LNKWNDGHVDQREHKRKSREDAFLYLAKTRPSNRLPVTKFANATTLGKTYDRPEAALLWPFPLLVIPPCLEIPLWPFEVARTARSTVAVFPVFV